MTAVSSWPRFGARRHDGEAPGGEAEGLGAFLGDGLGDGDGEGLATTCVGGSLGLALGESAARAEASLGDSSCGAAGADGVGGSGCGMLLIALGLPCSAVVRDVRLWYASNATSSAAFAHDGLAGIAGAGALETGAERSGTDGAGCNAASSAAWVDGGMVGVAGAGALGTGAETDGTGCASCGAPAIVTASILHIPGTAADSPATVEAPPSTDVGISPSTKDVGCVPGGSTSE